ncbi:MAG: hypothetical protein IPH13_23095 [Planctomycetes bacterium]|nr:hypothetical protein [Planctomycetota bacterium]MCC7170697.1 hypothetical protein [Planctomycetota bacterium]
MRRRILLLAVSLMALAIVDGALSAIVLRDGSFRGRRVAPFHPPTFTSEQRDLAQRLRDGTEVPATNVRFDAELGWTTRESFVGANESYDALGARGGSVGAHAPRASGVDRVAAFGCSFTHADEVADADAWCARLDELRADVEVQNFGVGAYGLDQALLRYRRVASELDVDEVWLGFMPRAALRVVSMYRPALAHEDRSVALKPRFEFDDRGGLAFVPLPVASARELGELLCAPDDRFVTALAAHDAFVGAWASAFAPHGDHLWHRSFTARLLVTKLEGGARPHDDVLRDATSECSRVLRAVVAAFRADVEARGDRFRLLILPDRPSLDGIKAARAGGPAPAYATIVEALQADGVDVVDVTDALAIADGPGAGLFAPGGHWSPAGNRVVAERLARLFD